MAVGLYSAERAAHISHVIDQIEAAGVLQTQQTEPEIPVDEWVYVRIKNDIPAATDPETGYYTGIGYVVPYTSVDDRDRETLTETENELEIVNRTSSVLAEGEYYWTRYIDAERVPFNASGGGGSRTIFFRITEVDCYSGDWWVTLTHVSDCLPIPHTREDGLVLVKPSCCMSPYTKEQLEASGYGNASYVYPVAECGENGQWREVTHCADEDCGTTTGECDQ
jgi:hypothetical protein